jgi:hypothetical protein
MQTAARVMFSAGYSVKGSCEPMAAHAGPNWDISAPTEGAKEREFSRKHAPRKSAIKAGVIV